MKVLIAVTHLLGTGHLARALTLARAFIAQGHEAHVVSGGGAAPHLNTDGVPLIQLPPLASDVHFTRLLMPNGQEADIAYLTARSAAIVQALTQISPDLVITELFPFGRRSLSTEFLTLLDATTQMAPKPVVLASIRDILAPPSKPKKADRCAAILADYYDGVLVHSDPHIVSLDVSWPVTDEMRPLLKYTGFVAPMLPDASDGAKGEVLVSAGGGDVGASLFAVAIEAARQSDLTWRILVGGAQAADRIVTLQTQAPDNVTVEPVRADFRALLGQAKLSISMCGYNTAMDVLQAGIPAVIVPFDDGSEVEQTLRAAALNTLAGIEIITSQELSGPRLTEAVNAVLSAPPRDTSAINFEGAAQAVKIAEQMVACR